MVTLDPEKLAHFKKITKPDTITQAALGNVWYVIVDGNYEFYTAKGYHPIDTQLKLQRLTNRIIIMHIHPEQ
jgi:hypothetical protein